MACEKEKTAHQKGVARIHHLVSTIATYQSDSLICSISLSSAPSLDKKDHANATIFPPFIPDSFGPSITLVAVH
jgi:hypothetical protein